MAHVVVLRENKPARAVAGDFSDRAVAHLECPRPVQIQADDDVAEGADDATVRNRDCGALEFLKCIEGA